MNFSSTQSSPLAAFAPPIEAPRPATSSDAISSDVVLSDSTLPAAFLREKDKPSPMKETKVSTPEPEDCSMQVIVVTGAAALEPYVAAWQELADCAAEPNVFYEPWMLIPALESFASKPSPEFYLIFSPGRGPESPKPQLCGLFPLVRGRRYKGLRTPVLRLWKHLYCPICTPLLKRGLEGEVLNALLDFLASQPRGATLLEMPYVSADGPFGRAQVEVFNQRGTTTFVDEIWTRAMLRPQPETSGEEYLKLGMSGKHRKGFRRKENRLADHGPIAYTELEHEADPDSALEGYIGDFLRLESSGWKGETGSAFACNPTHTNFFRTVATQAYARKRLGMATLRLNGEAIAVKCDLMAGTGAFAFKIAFNEEYGRYSPGVLLEMEGIRQLHLNSSLHWMDSCAAPNHPMINRLWMERRTLQTVVVATGQGRGEFIVASLPLVRFIKKLLARRRASGSPATSSTPSHDSHE